MLQTARACNGCGGCRTQADSERMCPIFRFSPVRRNHAASQSESDAGDPDRSTGCHAAQVRGTQERGRPVRQLPPMPLGMPRQRRHSTPDDRMQGAVRGRQRAVDHRLVSHASGSSRRLGQPVPPGRQLGRWQSHGPLAGRKAAGHRAGSQTAARRSSQFSAASRPAATHAPHAPQRPKGALLSSTSTPTGSTRNWPTRWWP